MCDLCLFYVGCVCDLCVIVLSARYCRVVFRCSAHCVVMYVYVMCVICVCGVCTVCDVCDMCDVCDLCVICVCFMLHVCVICGQYFGCVCDFV